MVTVGLVLINHNLTFLMIAHSIAGQFSLPYILEVRPSQEFAYEPGKRKLVDLQLRANAEPSMSFITPGEEESYEHWGENPEPGFTCRQGSLLRLSGWIDTDSRLSIGCAGAVISYLSRRRSVKYLPGDTEADDAFRISAIETFNLKDTM